MSPADLKRLNIEHFQRVLTRTAEPEKRAHIERLIAEERAKSDRAYPPDNAPQAPGR